MTGCLYFSTSSVKAAVSPCFTRSIRAASGSGLAGMTLESGYLRHCRATPGERQGFWGIAESGMRIADCGTADWGLVIDCSATGLSAIGYRRLAIGYWLLIRKRKAGTEDS